MRGRRLVVATSALMVLVVICSLAGQANASPSIHKAVAIAKSLVGTPYRYGGTTPKGFDCSGLIFYSFRHAGYMIPRTTSVQFESTFPVKKTNIEAGDILFFRIDGKISHVGLYVGKGRFIHAPSHGKRVSYESLDSPYWAERLVKAGRFF